MLPDIDSLALFVRAAELKSLTKAAEASHIGLAAASRRMAMLEQRFRTTLFERSSKGVELTPAGASLLPHARSLLVGLNQMQAEMYDHAHGRKGALRLLANTSVMTNCLPSDLAMFGKQNPDVAVVVEELWSVDIVRALQAGEADVGIVVEGAVTGGLESMPYCSDSLAIVMRPDHALATFERLTFADILDDDLITLESFSSMTQLVVAQAIASERTLKLRAQVKSFEAICHMVEAGLGVGLLPEKAAKVLAPGLELIVRPLDNGWAKRTMLLCFRPERAELPTVKKLIDFLFSRGHPVNTESPVEGLNDEEKTS